MGFAWCFVLTTCLSKWKTIWMFNSNRSLVHIERSPIVRHGLNIWHHPSLRDNSWADVSLTKKAIIWHNHQSTAWLIKRQRRDISIEALRARENWLLAPKLSWDPKNNDIIHGPSLTKHFKATMLHNHALKHWLPLSDWLQNFVVEMLVFASNFHFWRSSVVGFDYLALLQAPEHSNWLLLAVLAPKQQLRTANTCNNFEKYM